MKTTLCPNPDSLAALLEGGEEAELADHLETCEICQGTLAKLAADESSWTDVARYLPLVGDNLPETLDSCPPALERGMVLLKDELPLFLQKAKAADSEEFSLSFLSAPDRPGLLGYLGDYEMLEVIGRGGMGLVLKAFDPPLKRLVAIKVMALASLIGSATARRRFTREAQAAAAVCHENIVPVYGVYETDEFPYLVMQYVAGESLEARLGRTGSLPLLEIVQFALQTAMGLAAAHAHGLIHRDIKPANLLLENGGRVKITDFGLARMIDDVQLTQDGVVPGTPEYMAPEQARGEPVDSRADLFSLGSVLYAMATGGSPFRGNSTVAILRQVSDQAPAPIRTLNPNMPAWLDALVARLLAKDPAVRFQSAAEVADMLTAYLAHLEQPETVAIPDMPKVAKTARRKRFRFLINWLPGFFILVATGLGGAAGFAGCGGPDANLGKEASEFHHDFRGQTLPKESFKPHNRTLEWINGVRGKPFQLTPEGLLIKVPKTSPIGPKWGVGFQTTFGLKGDLDAILTFENFHVESPSPGSGFGLAFQLRGIATDRQNVQMSRVMAAGSQGVRWIWWHGSATEEVLFPCTETEGRLRFKRTASTLHLMWAPGIQGDNYQTIKEIKGWDFDVETVLFHVYTGGAASELEARLLDLRIRGNRAIAPILNPRKGGVAAALLVGMITTLALGVGMWLFARRRRRNVSVQEPRQK